MYLRDLAELASMHEGTFGDIWQAGNVHQLIQDGPVRDSLKMLDPTALRAQYLLSPSPTQSKKEVIKTGHEAPQECYRCTIGLPNGGPCNMGKPFDTKKAYLAHLQKGHKMSEKQYQNSFVVTNVCPICEKHSKLGSLLLIIFRDLFNKVDV